MQRLLVYIGITVFLLNIAYPKSLNIDFDGAVFRNDTSGITWELYYAIPDTSFYYVYEDGSFTGSLNFNIKLNSENGFEQKYDWLVKYSSKEKIPTSNQILLGVKKIDLKPGKYKAKIEVYDLNDIQTKASQDFEFLIKDFSKKGISTSDILLSGNAVHMGDSTVKMWDDSFLKGDYYVIPNPSLEYYGTKPEVITYSEFYNNSNADSIEMMLDYLIYDSRKALVLKDNKNKSIVGYRMSLIYFLPVEKLHSGAYTLEIRVKYKTGPAFDSVSAYKKIYLINPDRPPRESSNFSENIVFEKSEFITMGEEKIEEEINQAKLIATIFEAQRFDELSTLAAKQRALFNFWITRDPDTTTSFNEKRIEFKNMIDYANSYFSFGLNNSGWNTERGRILLKYGQPAQRDVYAAEDNKKAYETWIYNIQNQLTFNFVDLQGFGNFILVHSNGIGYIKNENWYNMYVKEVNLNNDIDDYNNTLINSTPSRSR